MKYKELSEGILRLINHELPKYFSKYSEEEGEESKFYKNFIKSLIEEDDLEFYEKLLEGLCKQGDNQYTKFFIVSCFLRDFFNAKELEDLETLKIHAGHIPKMIMEIRKTEKKQKDAKANEANEVNEANEAEVEVKKLIDDLSRIIDKSNKVDELLSSYTARVTSKIILEYLKDEDGQTPSQNLLTYLNKSRLSIATKNLLKNLHFPEITKEELQELKKLTIQSLVDNGLYSVLDIDEVMPPAEAQIDKKSFDSTSNKRSLSERSSSEENLSKTASDNEDDPKTRNIKSQKGASLKGGESPVQNSDFRSFSHP